MENLSNASKPNFIPSQSSKSQNPIKTPKHFTMALTHAAPNSSPSRARTATRISEASCDFDAAMPPGGTRGRAMAMNDTTAERATGSSASAASRAEMAAAKYAGGVRGRDSAAMLERRAAAVARRWRCCGAAELA